MRTRMSPIFLSMGGSFHSVRPGLGMSSPTRTSSGRLARMPTCVWSLWKWLTRTMFTSTGSGWRKAFRQPDPVEVNIVLVSHFHNDHTQVGILANRPDEVLVGLDMPKPGRTEWKDPPIDKKIGDIRVRMVGTYHDTEMGMKRGKNAVWIVEVDGLIFCHLGDLGHELAQEQLEAIKASGPIDVLMVPVGGIYTLNGEQ